MSNAEKPPTRPARAVMADDIVVPFTIDALDVRGRIARLGPSIDPAIGDHDLPAPAARLLGGVMALTTLLGTSLKFDGKLIVQVQGDGPVHLLLADYAAGGAIRGLARFDAERLAALTEERARDEKALLGDGTMALTIDQGPRTERWQGVVAIAETLAATAQAYFARSEQLPTRLRLAAGPVSTADGEHWRAGAAMIQHLPGHDDEERRRDTRDQWDTATALFDTIADDELLDPGISPERLLYRLYHEQGVRVFDPVPVRWRCSCARDTLKEVLGRFSGEERAAM
ncbi:MAG TPA: Hsp33 family molecular chaperone, partial [Thermopetrobacter sp.]|nr:Hsp33 family molecular chaperone [Thermopetrobacter sp.]